MVPLLISIEIEEMVVEEADTKVDVKADVMADARADVMADVKADVLADAEQVADPEKGIAVAEIILIMRIRIMIRM